MKLSEDKEEPTKKTGKQGLQRKGEKQANTHLGSQVKTVSRRTLSSIASNSAYRSPKMKVKEESIRFNKAELISPSGKRSFKGVVSG